MTYLIGLLGVATAYATGTVQTMISTSSLGTSVDTVNGTTMDYFTVLLSHYWPFVVGFLILLAVWHFGKRIISAFS